MNEQTCNNAFLYYLNRILKTNGFDLEYVSKITHIPLARIKSLMDGKSECTTFEMHNILILDCKIEYGVEIEK